MPKTTDGCLVLGRGRQRGIVRHRTCGYREPTAALLGVADIVSLAIAEGQRDAGTTRFVKPTLG